MIATAAVAIDGASSFAQTTTGSSAGSKAAAKAPQSAEALAYTAGIGIYPGDPSENYDPVLVPDTSGNYRNLALLRPAYQSSSYDYNLTAQLVTDGIKDTELPGWIVVSTETGPLPKTEREVVFDHAPMNTLEIMGSRARVDIEIAGGASAPETDRIQLFVVSPNQALAKSLKFTIFTSDDGRAWQEAGSISSPAPASTAGYPPDFCASNHFFTPFIPLNAVSRSRFYRVECSMGSDGGLRDLFETTWRIGQVAFFRGDTRVEIGGPYSFTSAWISSCMPMTVPPNCR